MNQLSENAFPLLPLMATICTGQIDVLSTITSCEDLLPPNHNKKNLKDRSQIHNSQKSKACFEIRNNREDSFPHSLF